MSEKEHNFMKTLGLTLVVSLLLMIPVVVYLGIQIQNATPAVQAQSTVEEPAGKMKRAYPEFQTEESEVKPVRVAPKPTPPPPQPVSRPTPTPDNIPVGMEKAKLIASFGRPQMITTEVNEGRALETFHYILPQEGAETTVQLSGGKVVSATISSY